VDKARIESGPRGERGGYDQWHGKSETRTVGEYVLPFASLLICKSCLDSLDVECEVQLVTNCLECYGEESCCSKKIKEKTANGLQQNLK
jgi:hypothetical protein